MQNFTRKRFGGDGSQIRAAEVFGKAPLGQFAGEFLKGLAQLRRNGKRSLTQPEQLAVACSSGQA